MEERGCVKGCMWTVLVCCLISCLSDTATASTKANVIKSSERCPDGDDNAEDKRKEKLGVT